MDSKVINGKIKERTIMATKCLPTVSSCFLKSKKNVQHTLDWFLFTIKMQVFGNTETILKNDVLFDVLYHCNRRLSKIHEELQIWIWFIPYQRIPKK